MEKKIISSNEAPAAIGPYSQAVASGGLLFLSGQLPIDSETGLIGGDIVDQTRQVLENMKAVLKAAGSSLENVVKTTVFIQDMNDFNVINGIYSEYFTENHPARSCVEVTRLPKDVMIEVEAVAVI